MGLGLLGPCCLLAAPARRGDGDTKIALPLRIRGESVRVRLLCTAHEPKAMLSAVKKGCSVAGTFSRLDNCTHPRYVSEAVGERNVCQAAALWDAGTAPSSPHVCSPVDAPALASGLPAS